MHTPIGRLATAYTVAIAATSTQSNAVSANILRVLLVAEVDCWVRVGASPTADTDTSTFLPARYPLLIKVAPGEKIAAIANNSSCLGSLSVTEIAQ